jgi:hypothetical protein
MGLSRSRASKHRASAGSDLVSDQTGQLRDGRKAGHQAAGDVPAWRQPSLGAALGKLARQRNDGQHR